MLFRSDESVLGGTSIDSAGSNDVPSVQVRSTRSEQLVVKSSAERDLVESGIKRM